MKKNDIAHVRGCKWFCFPLTHEKKRNNIAHLWAHKWFFFIHISEEENNIIHLQARKWVLHSCKRRKEMILHTLGAQVILLFT